MNIYDIIGIVGLVLVIFVVLGTILGLIDWES